MTVWVVPVAAVALTIGAQRWSRHWWSRRVRDRLTPAPPPSAGRREAIIGWVERRTRRRAAIADDVAPTLDALARAVASGSTLVTAIEALGPPSPGRPFAAMVGGALDGHTLGTPLADALAAVGHRHDSSSTPAEVRLGLAVLESAARYGGATAAALDRAADAVRARRAVIAERAVQSAQARMSALVLTVLPLGFAAWTASGDARVRRFLLGSTLGAGCLAAGLACNLAGWAWMRRIIRGRP